MNITQVVRTTFICFVCSSLVFSVDTKDLNQLFKDKTITAKIDLPLIRSVYVTPEGQIDQERYQKRLLKQPPSILQGQTAKLTKIEVKNDVVHVFINRGGVPGFAMGRGSKMLTSRTKAGSRIEIEFGRKVRAEDLTQDMLLNAVSKVISIEGFTSQAVAIRPDETFDTSHRFDPVSGTKTNTMKPVTQTVAMSLLSAEVTPLTPRRAETISLISTFEITALNQQVVINAKRESVQCSH